MARILIIHSDRSARRFLEAHASGLHEINCVGDLAKGIHAINTQRPALIIAGLDVHKREALELLRAMRRNGTKIPTIVVGEAAAGVMQPEVMRLGAAAFLEYPMEPSVIDQAVAKVLHTDVEAEDGLPPITREEKEANLTDLESELNRKMRCFAGKNLVYIRSVIVGRLQTTKPRISLKCPLRKEYGHPPNVYYEYIRDVCCSNPGACPAYQEFQAKRTM
jgi:FixJ family two-component response regulator